jgi:uncharacterized membrane protein
MTKENPLDSVVEKKKQKQKGQKLVAAKCIACHKTKPCYVKTKRSKKGLCKSCDKKLWNQFRLLVEGK